MIECPKCKELCRKHKFSWADCEGKEWYQPAEIDSMCWFQMMWLIFHRNELAISIWPASPTGIGFIEYTQRQLKHHAYFEIPSLFKADLDMRLQKTKTDGKVLLRHIQGLTSETYFPLYPFNELDYEAKMALFYISGSFRNPKFKIPYSRWKADKRAGRRI